MLESIRVHRPYAWLFRMLHWVLGATLLVLIATGVSQFAAARPGWSPWAGRLPAWAWQGRVNVVHLWAAYGFVAALAAVLWLYFGHRCRRRWTHLALLFGGLLSLATAMQLLRPAGPGWVYVAARGTHAFLGLAVLPLALVWHLYHGFGPLRSALIPAFHPWSQFRWDLPSTAASLLGLCVGGGVAGVMYCPLGRVLEVPRIAAPADAASAPWDHAAALRLEVANGIGFDRGRTDVTLQALHDGTTLWVRAQWADAVEDRQYMPWEKTADGWRQRVVDPKDESTYYEDKFALIFPQPGDGAFARGGCTAYCHLGMGRAYGYKSSHEIVDVWHWKATRTDPTGQADDKYWFEPDFAQEEVGRFGDPGGSGGYKKNGAKADGHPAFLPRRDGVQRQGILPVEEAVPYSAELAAGTPTGSIIAGIVGEAFRGDRGDVLCRSRHAEGRWELLLWRKMDTGSKFDMRFEAGKSYPFGCAAFDRTSKRHAYNWPGCVLRLAP